jgi:hypothetical protein
MNYKLFYDQTMKIIPIFLILPFLALGVPPPKFYERDLINPDASGAGYRIEAMCRMMIAKTNQINGQAITPLKRNAILISNIRIKEAFVVLNKDSTLSLSLGLDKRNGEKLMSYFLSKYPFRVGDVIDVYQWEFPNIIFGIYPDAVGYNVRYRPLDPYS